MGNSCMMMTVISTRSTSGGRISSTTRSPESEERDGLIAR